MRCFAVEFVSPTSANVEVEVFQSLLTAQHFGSLHIDVPSLGHPGMGGLLHWAYQYILDHVPSADIVLIPRAAGPRALRNPAAVSLMDLHARAARCTSIGGTFDRLHFGHKLLLSICAVLASERVAVGVVVEPGRKELAERIEPYARRVAHAVRFICEIRPDLDIMISPLRDPVGPAADLPDDTLLVVSQDTVRGAALVNEARRSRGRAALDLVVTPLLRLGSGVLSSTVLRRAISWDGRVGSSPC